MKPVLILGLGNPLMGDDGVGWRVAELLADDPRLPDCADVICAGTDLLRWDEQMEGRKRILLIDAVMDDSAPGTVKVFEDRLEGLETRQWNVHHLSAPQAIALLRSVSPAMCGTRFLLFAVTIASAGVRSGLSAELSGRLPEILDLVLRNADSCGTSRRGNRDF